MKKVWQLQEAKNQLSQLVNSALKHGTQTITRHGKPIVMVVAADSYAKLKPRRKTVEVLRSCPADGLDLQQTKDFPRDIEL